MTLDNINEFTKKLEDARLRANDDSRGVGYTTINSNVEYESPKDKEIVLIAGKFSDNNDVRFWRYDLNEGIQVGDYAIVENKGDYAMVKIVGYVVTKEKYTYCLASKNITKKVIKYIERKEIRAD